MNRLQSSPGGAATIISFSTWIKIIGDNVSYGQSGSSSTQNIDDSVRSLFSSGSFIFSQSSSFTVNVAIYISPTSTLSGTLVFSGNSANMIRYTRIG